MPAAGPRCTPIYSISPVKTLYFTCSFGHCTSRVKNRSDFYRGSFAGCDIRPQDIEDHRAGTGLNTGPIETKGAGARDQCFLLQRQFATALHRRAHPFRFKTLFTFKNEEAPVKDLEHRFFFHRNSLHIVCFRPLRGMCSPAFPHSSGAAPYGRSYWDPPPGRCADLPSG